MKWKIRNMVLLLSVIPALLLALTIQLLAFSEQRSFGERSIEQTRQTLIKSRQDELVHYLDIAYSTIKPLYDGEDAMSPAVQEEARRRLRELHYGKDGYLFGYNDKGDRIFLAGKDEGKNFWNLKDSQGIYVVRELVAAAKRGGDFLTYYFPKPGNDSTSYPKLSYSIYLDKWNWTIGTGFYIDDMDALIADQMQHQQKVMEAMRWKQWGVMGVLLVMMSMAAAYVARSIAKPLLLLTHNLQALASEDGDLTSQLPIDGNEETAQLAGAFNSFVGKIRAMVVDLARCAQLLQERNEQLKQSAQHAADALTLQSKDAEQVAHAMEQMAVATHNVAESAQSAALSTRHTNDQAKVMRTNVEETINTIGGLAREIEQSTQGIQTLGNDVESISSILDVVRAIADQTNLLALNAAIEAARAGEQGRGFAVVADEVRSLAQRTQQSTEEIQNKISQLQQAARTAVSNMQGSLKGSETAVTKVNIAGQILTGVSYAVSEIHGMNSQIATAAEEQSNIGVEIKQNLSRISKHIRETQVITTRNNDMCLELDKLSQELNLMVNRFRV